MYGTHAFCPESGANLSSDSIVVDNGSELRYPENDQAYGEDSYLLTTGETCSSKIALMSRFRECHERHFGTRWTDDERTAELYRQVASHLRKLKSDGESDSPTRDEWIWFALAERLDRDDYPTDWMHAHADQVCPQCGGQLQWLEAPRGILPKCANNCGGENQFVQHNIRSRVATVYNCAFNEGLKPTEVGVL